MKKQTRDVLYYTHSRNNPPTLTIEPGESIVVETEMCSGDWLCDITDTYDPNTRRGGPNPSSGCTYVRGAAPGDMLAVTIESIVPNDLGYTGFGPGANPFPDWIRQKEWGVVTKTVRIRDGFVEWSDQLKLPIRPMIGVIGTAPEFEEFLNSRNGPYGGNLDAQEVTTGATVYLPVYVEGGLLHVGDVHAIQGDGEVCCGGGIECRATVQLRVDVLPPPAADDVASVHGRHPHRLLRVCPPGGGCVPAGRAGPDLLVGRRLLHGRARGAAAPRPNPGGPLHPVR